LAYLLLLNFFRDMYFFQNENTLYFLKTTTKQQKKMRVGRHIEVDSDQRRLDFSLPGTQNMLSKSLPQA